MKGNQVGKEIGGVVKKEFRFLMDYPTYRSQNYLFIMAHKLLLRQAGSGMLYNVIHSLIQTHVLLWNPRPDLKEVSCLVSIFFIYFSSM